MHHGQVLGVAGLLLRVLAMAGGTQQAGALRVHQVHRTAGATGGTHQLVQHTRQHQVGARFGADVVGDVQELLDGVGHAVHHLPQIAHLAHRRRPPFGSPEIKPRQRPGLQRQPEQAAPHAPTSEPAQRQHQADERHRQPYLLAQVVVHISQQLFGRDRHQDMQPLPAHRRQWQRTDQPFLAIGLHAARLAIFQAERLQSLQAGNTQVVHVTQSQAGRFAIAQQYARHVGVGQHAAVLVHHCDLGAGHQAQAADLMSQVGQCHVQANHRTPVSPGWLRVMPTSCVVKNT